MCNNYLIITSPLYSSQENQIHQRIADLRKEGLWSLRRLPKLQEAPRPKSHWDYLLEEMQWMATDFAQERRWKVAAARKVGEAQGAAAPGQMCVQCCMWGPQTASQGFASQTWRVSWHC